MDVWVAPVCSESVAEEGVSPDTVFIVPVGGLDFKAIVGNAIRAIPHLSTFDMHLSVWVIDDAALACLPPRSDISARTWDRIKEHGVMTPAVVTVKMGDFSARISTYDLVGQPIWFVNEGCGL